MNWSCHCHCRPQRCHHGCWCCRCCNGQDHCGCHPSAGLQSLLYRLEVETLYNRAFHHRPHKGSVEDSCSTSLWLYSCHENAFGRRSVVAFVCAAVYCDEDECEKWKVRTRRGGNMKGAEKLKKRMKKVKEQRIPVSRGRTGKRMRP